MAKILTYEKRRDYFWILVGTLIMALAANLFFVPANIVPGGFTGLSMLISELSKPFFKGGIPVGVINAVLNIPLVLFSIKLRGWAFMRRTFVATVLYSLWLMVIPVRALVANDLFLTSILGGAIIGVGLGLILYGKATTGGTDTLAAIIQYYLPHLSVSRIFPFCDAVVILLSVWVFGLQVSMYAVISVIVSGMVAESTVSGFRNAYFAYIISAKYEEVAEEIMRNLDRGVTGLKGKGMYTKNERPVLICAVSKKQAALLKDVVMTIDPDAFVILTDAKEIRGEGFLAYSKEEL